MDDIFISLHCVFMLTSVLRTGLVSKLFLTYHAKAYVHVLLLHLAAVSLDFYKEQSLCKGARVKGQGRTEESETH